MYTALRTSIQHPGTASDGWLSAMVCSPSCTRTHFAQRYTLNSTTVPFLGEFPYLVLMLLLLLLHCDKPLQSRGVQIQATYLRSPYLGIRPTSGWLNSSHGSQLMRIQRFPPSLRPYFLTLIDSIPYKGSRDLDHPNLRKTASFIVTM
jgi:hypothetical protein